MRIVAIIQARLGSTRLPSKVFSSIGDKCLLEHVLNRAGACANISDVWVATTNSVNDDTLEEWCLERNVNVFRGPEDDVLSRYCQAAEKSNAEIIARVTADDPFKVPEICDSLIDVIVSQKFDVVTNTCPPSWPEGLDYEVFTLEALQKADKMSRDPYEREHVTQFFYRNPSMFGIKNVSADRDYTGIRVTVDTVEDLETVRKLYEKIQQSKEDKMSWNCLKGVLESNPDILTINTNVKRSAMYGEN